MNITQFTKLFQIFVQKKWTDQNVYEIVLENFCNLLMNLTDHQRELVLELAERYVWISSNEYQAKLTNILKSIENEKLLNCKRIIVFPIMKPEDEENVKSSHTIVYMIRGLMPFINEYDNIEIIELIKYDEIKEDHFKPRDSDLIFLVDDYLGSGETIKLTLDNVLSNRSIQLEQLNVIAIASQQDTIEFVKNCNIPIYYDLVQKRGISDYYDPAISTEKINTMLEIEELISGCGFFSLGYNQSEALITMIRTPDNTFPIFWKEHQKNGQEYKPPFPRY